MLRTGYSNAAIRSNVREMLDTGHTRAQAVAASYSLARAAFFRRYPHGALPAWLAYPAGYRLKQHYNRDGTPVSLYKPLESMQKNPSPATGREIQKAARLFRQFTGRAPDRIEKIPLHPLPRTGLAFGELVEVRYISFRDGRPYRHPFRLGSRPLLVATHDGKQVLMLGGAYAFTERGIEDR